MKKMHCIVAVAATAACLTGCAATAYRINRVQTGMTKAQVIQTVGRPVSVSAKDETEYLNYRFSETDEHAFHGITTPYYVRLVNGQVDSWGRLGDFDSTQNQKIEIKREDIISADVNTSSKGQSDMYAELMKLKQLKDEGIINDDEFQKQKKRIMEKY